MRIATTCLLAVLLVPAAGGQEFAGNALFATAGSGNTILELTAGGAVSQVWATTAGMDAPVEMRFGPNGHLYVASSLTGTVFELAGDGLAVRQIGAGSGLAAPYGLEIGRDGRIFVSAPTQNLVYEFAPSGTLRQTFDAGGAMNSPRGLCTGPEGHLFVCSYDSDRVLELGPEGNLLRELGVGSALSGPDRVVLGPGDHLFVTSGKSDRIIEFDGAGNEVNVFGAAAGMSGPAGCAFGPDGILYVADTGNDSIYRFTSDGTFVGSAPTPTGDLVALAFAPFRFTVEIVGTAERIDSAEVRIDEQANLSIRAGSKRLTLELTDDPGNDEDLASLAGTALLVFHGFEGYRADESERRFLAGAQVGPDSAATGFRSMVLKAKGAVDGDDRFVVASAKGSVYLAGGFVLKAKVKTRRRLE